MARDEYELNGADRALYGAKMMKELASRLNKQGVKHLRERHLYLCKDFYYAYPNILRTVSSKLYLSEIQRDEILRTATAKLEIADDSDLKMVDSVYVPINQNEIINGIVRLSILLKY
jgi:hypothetical protein